MYQNAGCTSNCIVVVYDVTGTSQLRHLSAEWVYAIDSLFLGIGTCKYAFINDGYCVFLSAFGYLVPVYVSMTNSVQCRLRRWRKLLHVCRRQTTIRMKQWFGVKYVERAEQDIQNSFIRWLTQYYLLWLYCMSRISHLNRFHFQQKHILHMTQHDQHRITRSIWKQFAFRDANFT